MEEEKISGKVEMYEPPQKYQKRVAIVGCSGSKDLAPFNDPTWEIWGVNNLFYFIPRYDKWFEIHNITQDSQGNFQRRGGDEFRGQSINEYIRDLGKMSCPVVMQRVWAEIPTSTPYPLAAVKERFGALLGWYGKPKLQGVPDENLNYRLYGTNTITYMLLLAILEGATEIGIWGVDMAVDTEYQYQRPSCEWAVGLAVGLGIPVYIPDEADLLKTITLYGFEEKLNNAWVAKLKKMETEMRERQIKTEKQLEEANRVLGRAEGAYKMISHLEGLLQQPGITLSIIAEALKFAKNELAPQEKSAKEASAKAYATLQQYIGAQSCRKELLKIWETIK